MVGLLVTACGKVPEVEDPNAGTHDSETDDTESGSDDTDEEIQAIYTSYVVAPENAERLNDRWVPSFLNAAQQQLYLDAQHAYCQFTVTCDGFGSTDSGQDITIGTRVYFPADGKYNDWRSFEAAMLALFTPEYFDKLNYCHDANNPNFIEYDGKLYYSPGGRGGSLTDLGLYAYEPVLTTNSVIRFKEIDIYAHPEGDPDGEPYTEGVDLEIVNTPAGWRFSLFNVTY